MKCAVTHVRWYFDDQYSWNHGLRVLSSGLRLAKYSSNPATSLAKGSSPKAPSASLSPPFKIRHVIVLKWLYAFVISPPSLAEVMIILYVIIWYPYDNLSWPSHVAHLRVCVAPAVWAKPDKVGLHIAFLHSFKELLCYILHCKHHHHWNTTIQSLIIF